VKYALTRPETSVCMHTVAVSQKTDEAFIVSFGNKIIVYDACNGSEQQISEWHTDRVVFVHCFGGVYLSASVDGILREVDSSLKAVRQKNLQYRIRTVNVSLTETNVAVCADTAQILILDAVTWEVLADFHDGTNSSSYFGSVRFSTDESKLLATVYSNSQHGHVYDMHSGSLLFHLDITGHVCYNVDSTCIFSSRPGEEIVYWDVENGTQLLGNPFPTTELSHNCDYNRLLVFSPGTTILM
jgi:hypothetical protein